MDRLVIHRSFKSPGVVLGFDSATCYSSYTVFEKIRACENLHNVWTQSYRKNFVPNFLLLVMKLQLVVNRTLKKIKCRTGSSLFCDLCKYRFVIHSGPFLRILGVSQKRDEHHSPRRSPGAHFSMACSSVCGSSRWNTPDVTRWGSWLCGRYCPGLFCNYDVRGKTPILTSHFNLVRR